MIPIQVNPKTHFLNLAALCYSGVCSSVFVSDISSFFGSFSFTKALLLWVAEETISVLDFTTFSLEPGKDCILLLPELGNGDLKII